MSKASEQAKRAYVDLCVRVGKKVDLKTFCDMSQDLVAKQLNYDRVKHWAVDEDWYIAVDHALAQSDTRQGIHNILDLAWNHAMSYGERADAKDLYQYAQAYYYQLQELTDPEMVQELERIEKLRGHIRDFMETHGAVIGGQHLRSLTRTNSMLHKKLIPLTAMEGEGAVDPDAYLLGIEETDNG